MVSYPVDELGRRIGPNPPAPTQPPKPGGSKGSGSSIKMGPGTTPPGMPGYPVPGTPGGSRPKTPQEIANEQAQANVGSTTEANRNDTRNITSDFDFGVGYGNVKAGQHQIRQQAYEDQALEALRQQGSMGLLKQQQAQSALDADAKAKADRDSLAERDKYNKLAEQRRLGYINQLGSGGPAVDEGGAADSTAARNAAFAREKDRIGQMGRGAVNSLTNLMSSSGLSGGGYEGKGQADIVSGTQGQLGDVAREQTIQDLNRADALADRNYQGRVTQRGQNVNYKQSLLGLMNAGGCTKVAVLTQHQQQLKNNAEYQAQLQQHQIVPVQASAKSGGKLPPNLAANSGQLGSIKAADFFANSGGGGSSTKKAGNTAAQEQFIGGLNTSGALDEGSGFERKFGSGETNDQYSARLEEWKKNKGGPGINPPPGGGGAPGSGGPQPTPTTGTQALEGLQGAGGGGQPNVAMDGGGGPVDLPAVGALRSGLGTRIYPDMNAALAGLRKVY